MISLSGSKCSLMHASAIPMHTSALQTSYSALSCCSNRFGRVEPPGTHEKCFCFVFFFFFLSFFSNSNTSKPIYIARSINLEMKKKVELVLHLVGHANRPICIAIWLDTSNGANQCSKHRLWREVSSSQRAIDWAGPCGPLELTQM